MGYFVSHRLVSDESMMIRDESMVGPGLGGIALIVSTGTPVRKKEYWR